jgi:hypothetical protein
LPAENLHPANSCTIAESIGDNPIAGTAVLSLPEKPTLWLAWKIRLMAGTLALPLIKGREELDFFEGLDQVLPFLKLCDERFDTRIARPMISALRARFLKPRGESEAPSGPDITFKIIYDIRIWATSTPTHQTKGSLETTLQLETRSMRGQIGLLEGSLLRTTFNPVRANFRHVAAYLVERLVPHESAEAALMAIRQEIQSILKPDIVPANELPITIEDIDVVKRQNGG